MTPSKMGEADRRTIAGGTEGMVLMERAGTAAARVIRGRYAPRKTIILCGPGQNGGDGWVVARLLRNAGWDVTVHSDWPDEELKGDAQKAARRSGISPIPLSQARFSPDMLVIDALFGAGLARPIEGGIAEVVGKAAQSGAPIVAIDLPSGLSGETGAILGAAAPADATITFERPKPGHFTGEGRSVCGDLFVRPIGIEIEADDACAVHNAPGIWQAALPFPPAAAHKYERGGLIVVGGARHAGGAGRLAAKAGARIGAGATTVLARGSALDLYAAHFDAIMVKRADTEEDFAQYLAGKAARAVVVGPGLGVDGAGAGALQAVLDAGLPSVLDADALTLLAGREEAHTDLLPQGAVLTPHEGEFVRLFGDIEGDALTRTRKAAERCGATVLLKGATTVIATPGQTPVINTHASPYLATAGSGDVLAGLIGGLLAQGLAPHIAAAAATWCHGDAARRMGAGLTADDLPDLLPGVIASLGS